MPPERNNNIKTTAAAARGVAAQKDNPPAKAVKHFGPQQHLQLESQQTRKLPNKTKHKQSKGTSKNKAKSKNTHYNNNSNATRDGGQHCQMVETQNTRRLQTVLR